MFDLETTRVADSERIQSARRKGTRHLLSDGHSVRGLGELVWDYLRNRRELRVLAGDDGTRERTQRLPVCADSDKNASTLR